MGAHLQRRQLAEVKALHEAGGADRGRESTQNWDGFGLTLTVSKVEQERADLYAVGDLDLASAGVLAACLENQIAGGRRFVRLDMSRLAFVDSAGIGAVHAAHEVFLEERGTLIVTGLMPRHAWLVKVLGLDSVLLIAAPMTYPLLASAIG